MPQTRFVLRKALEARLPVICVINKVDRPDARIDEVHDEVLELFLDLDADDEQVDFPVVYANARAGWVSLAAGEEGTDLQPLLDLMVERIPAPEYDPEAPLQAHVTNLDADPYVGRLALCRVHNGTIRAGQPIAWCRANGTIERANVAGLYVTEALDRVRGERGGPGEIIAVSGIDEVTIGETLADPDDPRPLPVITVDEPSLAIVVGVNNSPLAGPRGQQADRAPDRGPARRRAGRQRLDPGRGHRSQRRLGGPRARRAAAGRAARADAPRGLRAHREPAPGPDPGGRRQALRAGRTACDRHPRGLRRGRHPDARAAQGADGADGQPLDRLGAARVPRAGARPDRLPDRVPDRDPRHRPASPRVRALGAVGRRDAGAADRLAGLRPRRDRRELRPPLASRTAAASSSAPGPRSTRG